MPEFLLSVSFNVEPVAVKVEADSMADAWSRRFDLASTAEPDAYEIVPTSIEPCDV